ncbi:hypothetical protein EQV77_12550 [Halobacillus fulvus]|nr:hypothetical protein EQV77_12550 [Halobacillus fulvus]
MKLLGYHYTKVNDEPVRKWEEGQPKNAALEIMVDDAEAFAKMASSSGAKLYGPVIESGKKVYSILKPNRMPIKIHSPLSND